MVENVFGVLFLVTLAGVVLAVIGGIALLALPVKKASRPFATANGAVVHS